MENFKDSKYPRGSEWRRWDLHIHTPESKLGTSFPSIDWEEYVTALEEAALANGIAVVGITDYMSIDGYEKALESKAHPTNPRLGAIALLIPNIELRVLPATKDSKALNVHVLVDPTAPDHVDRIKRAMRQLRVKYNGETYGCCRDELIEFARKQQADLEDEEVAYTIHQGSKGEATDHPCHPQPEPRRGHRRRTGHRGDSGKADDPALPKDHLSQRLVRARAQRRVVGNTAGRLYAFGRR